MSARTVDVNDFILIKDNPISKMGVFEYLGKQIDPTGSNENIKSDTAYNVYRPEEELADAECIESFKLVPWIDDHVMLGSEDRGRMAPEKKGVLGVTGENIYFEAPYLKADLKIFSESLASAIENGKKELSIGYLCTYEPSSGVYEGKSYDFIQRKIRGNHLATVEEGRSGPDVSVLDHFKFTFDSKELKNMQEVKKVVDEALSLEGLASELKEIRALIAAMSTEKTGDEEFTKPTEGELKKTEDEEGNVKEAEEVKETKDEETKKEEKEKSEGMDAKLKKQIQRVAMDAVHENVVKTVLSELNGRNDLAQKLSYAIGTFDHSNMTSAQLVEYGLKKLKLQAHKGQEISVLSGYLQGRKDAAVSTTMAMDSVIEEGSQIAKYIKGEK
jgi:hypothetical protein